MCHCACATVAKVNKNPLLGTWPGAILDCATPIFA